MAKGVEATTAARLLGGRAEDATAPVSNSATPASIALSRQACSLPLGAERDPAPETSLNELKWA